MAISKIASASGVRLAAAASSVALANPPASTVETAIITTPTLNLPFDNAAVLILWYWNGGWGTGTTAVTANVRRGSGVSGLLLTSANPLTAVAGNQFTLSGCWIDTPGVAAGLQYTLSLVGTGTTGAGNTAEACVMAFVL